MEKEILGWTLSQWEIALARIPSEGDTLKDFMKVRLEWQKKYNYSPGEVQIAGVKIERNFDQGEKIAYLMMS